MSNLRTASRYATALIDLAIERGSLEQIHGDMQRFTKVCEENYNFRLMLKNPIINHERKFAVIKGIFGKQSDPVTMAFFDIIRRKKRESYLPEIASEFHRAYNRHKHITTVRLETAFTLSAAQKSQLMDLIRRSLGGEVEVYEKVDPTLIGGFVMTMNDSQVDGSVKRKLIQIKNSFSNN